jgi:[ribosomal protein S18]-alanine N-acetyltransferase
MAVFQTIRNLFVPFAHDATPDVVVPAPWTKYEVKPLTIKNLDELLRLNLRCFRNGENYNKHTFKYLLTQPHALGYMATTEAGDIVGFVLVVKNDDGTAHITTVGVAPEHRRRGIAERLIEQVDDALRRREISTVVLEVRVSNFAAQNLYRRAGYNVVQRMQRYYHNGEDGFLMMKSLV